MYSDPTKIRSHVTKIRLSDEEEKLIQAYVDYTGEQKAVLLRELILEAAASSLGFNNAPVLQAVEGSFGAFNRAG